MYSRILHVKHTAKYREIPPKVLIPQHFATRGTLMDARKAKLGLEAQNYAAEIYLDGSRKAGEILAQLNREKGGNSRHGFTDGMCNAAHTVSEYALVLSDTGTTRQESQAGYRVEGRRGLSADNPQIGAYLAIPPDRGITVRIYSEFTVMGMLSVNRWQIGASLRISAVRGITGRTPSERTHARIPHAIADTPCHRGHPMRLVRALAVYPLRAPAGLKSCCQMLPNVAETGSLSATRT